MSNTKYLFSVMILEARAIPILETMDTMETFCQVNCSNEPQRHKGKAIKRTQNPVWNEAFSFPLSNLDQHLRVKLYQKGLRSRYVASLIIPINWLEPAVEVEEWFALSDKTGFSSKVKGEGKGHLLVRLLLIQRSADNPHQLLPQQLQQDIHNYHQQQEKSNFLRRSIARLVSRKPGSSPRGSPKPSPRVSPQNSPKISPRTSRRTSARDDSNHSPRLELEVGRESPLGSKDENDLVSWHLGSKNNKNGAAGDAGGGGGGRGGGGGGGGGVGEFQIIETSHVEIGEPMQRKLSGDKMKITGGGGGGGGGGGAEGAEERRESLLSIAAQHDLPDDPQSSPDNKDYKDYKDYKEEKEEKEEVDVLAMSVLSPGGSGRNLDIPQSASSPLFNIIPEDVILPKLTMENSSSFENSESRRRRSSGDDPPPPANPPTHLPLSKSTSNYHNSLHPFGESNNSNSNVRLHRQISLQTTTDSESEVVGDGGGDGVGGAGVVVGGGGADGDADGEEDFVPTRPRIRSRERASIEQPITLGLGKERRVEKVVVWVGTWNVGNSPPPNDLSVWFPPPSRRIDAGQEAADIYVLGLQECSYDVARDLTGKPLWSSSKDDFLHRITSHFGHHYDLLGRTCLRDIRLYIFTKRANRDKVWNISKAKEATGIGNVVGNKGGAGISFNYLHTSLCFVTCHLAAHYSKCDARNDNFGRIINNINLGDNKGDLLSRFHYVFFLGDLNYRLEYGGQNSDVPTKQSFEQVVKLIEAEQYPELSATDQLLTMRREKAFLPGVMEGNLFFPPTFKLIPGKARVYDPKRLPAWCDRILWRCGPSMALTQTGMHSVEQMITSDHKPVWGTFTLDTSLLPRSTDPNLGECSLCCEAASLTECQGVIETVVLTITSTLFPNLKLPVILAPNLLVGSKNKTPISHSWQRGSDEPAAVPIGANLPIHIAAHSLLCTITKSNAAQDVVGCGRIGCVLRTGEKVTPHHGFSRRELQGDIILSHFGFTTGKLNVRVVFRWTIPTL